MKKVHQRSLIAALGATIALSLSAIPALAGPGDGGSFFVHAEDSKSPEFQATAGMDGRITNPGGGGALPALGVSYSCGPMTLAVSAAEAAKSATNLANLNAGKAAEDLGGWIVYAEDKPANMLKLYNSSFWDAAVAEVASPQDCQIWNFATPKSLGALTSYEIREGNAVSEGRAIAASGGRGYASAEIKRNGSFVRTHLDDREGIVFRSARDVNSYSVGEGGQVSFSLMPLESDPVYTGIEAYTDEVGYTVFTLHRHSPDLGPDRISLDPSGKVTGLSGKGKYFSGTTTKEEYNAATGSSWNGQIPKLSDFNLNPPFTPSWK